MFLAAKLLAVPVKRLGTRKVNLAVPAPGHFLAVRSLVSLLRRLAATIGRPDHKIDCRDNGEEEQKLSHGHSDL
jgi:hypothetical protein